MYGTSVPTPKAKLLLSQVSLFDLTQTRFTVGLGRKWIERSFPSFIEGSRAGFNFMRSRRARSIRTSLSVGRDCAKGGVLAYRGHVSARRQRDLKHPSVAQGWEL